MRRDPTHAPDLSPGNAAMTLAQSVVLQLLFGLTALNWALHWYTQVVTYRLFPTIAAQAGGAGFVAYHQAYEARLVWSIYVPWSALMVASVAFLVVRPDAVDAPWAWLLLVLNAAIAVVSVLFAVPVHRRVDAARALEPQDSRALLWWNLARLLIATASLGLATVLMLRVLIGQVAA